MARANRHTLNSSRLETERQQRHEQPEVPGATGTPDDVSPEAAEAKSPPTIKREPNTTQLIERGEGPTEEELVDPAVDVPNDGEAPERGKSPRP